ncbi:MAG: QcrA and Rieske domain-containing protein [Actinomycetota bacterium]
MKLTRRELLQSGWKIGTAALVLAAGWTTYESLRPLAVRGAGAKLGVGGVKDFATDTATYVADGRLYVTNAGGKALFALSQKCPHLGCRVPFCESSGRFECPCHGSIYDIAGEYVSGPAPRGMDRHPLSLAGDQVLADTSQTILGPPRGTDTYLTPPKGPGCVGGGA